MFSTTAFACPSPKAVWRGPSAFWVSTSRTLCPWGEIHALSLASLPFQMRMIRTRASLYHEGDHRGRLCFLPGKHSRNTGRGDVDRDDDGQDNGFVAKSVKFSVLESIYNQWKGLAALRFCSRSFSYVFTSFLFKIENLYSSSHG